MRTTLIVLLTMVSLLIFTATSHAQSAVFDFDSVAFDTPTPLTIMSNGLTATFSSPADPGGFRIEPSFFLTLSNRVLQSPGPSNQDYLSLTIQFNQPLSSIWLNFATADFHPSASTFLLEAFSGGINGLKVGAATAVGIFPDPNSSPEGLISFASQNAVFDRIELSVPVVLDVSGNPISSPFFAVDNVNVTAFSEPGTFIPEPGTFSLVAVTAITGVGFAFRRIRHQR